MSQIRWGRCEPDTARDAPNCSEGEFVRLDPLQVLAQLARDPHILHKGERLNAHRQLMVALAEWLCAHHRRDARAGRIVSDMHLHLLPTMNPDGCACRFHTCEYCAQCSYCLSQKRLCW